MSLCKSRSRENITAAAIVPFIEEQPTENKKLRFAKEKTPHLLVRSFLSPYGDGTYYWLAVIFGGVFSPPYGDGTSMLEIEPAAYLFSPPYGDCTEEDMTPDEFAEFSPPYGDGTDWVAYNCHFNEFSPPYGDGTVEWRGFFLCHFVFAPLRGWYLC